MAGGAVGASEAAVGMQLLLKENSEEPVCLPHLFDAFDKLGDALDNYEKAYGAAHAGRPTFLTLQRAQAELIASCGGFLGLAYELRLIFSASETFIRELDGYTSELLMDDEQGGVRPLPGLLEAVVAVDEQSNVYRLELKGSASSLSFITYLQAIHTLIHLAKKHGFLCTQMAF